MDDLTIFNLRVVNKGALKATVSIRLASGLTIHDCKIIQQDGALSAALPQRSERQKGGEVIYHDLVEFAEPEIWPAIVPQLVTYYQATSEASFQVMRCTSRRAPAQSSRLSGGAVGMLMGE